MGNPIWEALFPESTVAAATPPHDAEASSPDLGSQDSAGNGGALGEGGAAGMDVDEVGAGTPAGGEASWRGDDTAGVDLGSVSGLEQGQVAALASLSSHGVLWVHPSSKKRRVLKLRYGGEVDADGNCLFTALHRILAHEAQPRAEQGPVGQCPAGAVSPQALRRRAVRRFLKEYHASGEQAKAATDRLVQGLYCPDLTRGWGVHVLQEVKMLARKQDREQLDNAVQALVDCGLTRDAAVEAVCKEQCRAVKDGPAWADYMRVGSEARGAGEGAGEGAAEEDECEALDIVSLQYTDMGLLSADERWHQYPASLFEGEAGVGAAAPVAAFGDDIALESLASELGREIIVVQVHGGDAMLESELVNNSSTSSSSNSSLSVSSSLSSDVASSESSSSGGSTTPSAPQCLFFLPHKPKCGAAASDLPPIFLLMKGVGWCGAGADHYEPILVGHQRDLADGEAVQPGVIVL